MKEVLMAGLLLPALAATAQQPLTPEMLWQLGRVNASGRSKDKQFVV